jgi:NodT family efflux transporter outer membrane factor (OMF) lipoprotein
MSLAPALNELKSALSVHAVCHAFLTLLALADLTGCAGSRPPLPMGSSIPVAGAWRDGEPGEATHVQQNWWREFGDTTLDALVEQAIRENDDERIALARVAEARAAVRLARAALLPHVNAAGLLKRDAGISPFGLPDQETASGFDVSIAYETDIFGRVGHDIATAYAGAEEAEAARDAVNLTVESTTAAGYIRLRALDARLEVAQSTLTLRTESLHVAKRRFSAGFSSALELRQAESEYLATEQLIPALRLAIATQENALSVILGRAPGPIVRGSTLDSLKAPPTPRILPAAVVRQRPDIFAAEEALAAADETLSSARAAFLPDITLEAGAGRAFSTLFPEPITVWSIGGSVLAPIFEGGALHARQDIAAARRDRAAFVYRETVLIAFREVENELTTLRETENQVQMLSAQTEALAAAYQLATRRYRTGYSSYLEQLDSQRALLSSELTLVEMKGAYLISSVNLFRAVGGGWEMPVTHSANVHVGVVPSK